MTEDDFNVIAWQDFLVFALTTPDFREAFTRDTGHVFIPPPNNAIEAMVDAATGVNEAVIAAFVEWVTIHHWGIEHAPFAFQQALKDRPPTCDFRDAHDLVADRPSGKRCGAPATHRIEWADGRFSYGCRDHLTIDASASVKPTKIAPIHPIPRTR